MSCISRRLNSCANRPIHWIYHRYFAGYPADQVHHCHLRQFRIIHSSYRKKPALERKYSPTALHQLSSRSTSNFVKINCAAIPKDLLESELFGYEGGAFTGAKKGGKIGKFELADGGTLLLDEIGEMPLPLQSKLLRVLQEKEVERIGGVTPIKVDVRLICSTNQNLTQLIQDGRFRADLYYRINTIELAIPPSVVPSR